MMNELYSGRPVDETGRLEKELRVYDFLDDLGIAYDCVDTEPATDMEVCAEIDKILSVLLANWDLYRLGTIERVVLRLGIWEMKFSDVPKPVV
ncbi:MAG: hypothetical protein J6Y62_05410, partial [Clostridia bacterium]|nr:hypothetical protein [Clostridia bacterium]